jgi:di/tripeptidase
MNETFKLIVKHAGKEVARVLAVYYNAIGVSIGFNIREAHTPNESVEIASINKMYTLLQHLLVNITK